MTNRTNSSQHGLVHHSKPGNGRPKSKLRVRKNKAQAAERKELRRSEQAIRLEKARAALTK